VFSLLTTSSCNRKGAPQGEERPPAEGAASTDATHEESGRLPLAEVRGLRFLTVPPPRAEGAWFPAEAIADETAQAVLTAPVGGVVEKVATLPGRRVAAGTVLLVLRSPELARLKADWLVARARLGQARSEEEREQRLLAAGAGARRELEAASATVAAAEAESEAARLALDARGVRPESAGARLAVRAPGAGVVAAYRVQLSQGVTAGQELGLFQSANAALVKVELPLPPPASWRPGTLTEARSSEGRRWQARLEGVPMALSEDTRRLAYRLRLSGAALPLPGTPLEVRVALAEAPILPQTALQQVEGTWGVFVREGDEAVFRAVRRGVELGGDAMILEGVRPGETVVADGAYLLKSLLLKRRSGSDEHEH
jgi:cobalt-zinc-cadmium efflux system membrane fusion protein